MYPGSASKPRVLLGPGRRGVAVPWRSRVLGTVGLVTYNQYMIIWGHGLFRTSGGVRRVFTL